MPQPPADAPFSIVLSRAIQRRNLTLERLSARLRSLGTPVSIATLSYWQSGRSIPTRARSLKAVEHLERILSLPPGHLLSALPGDGTGRWDPLSVLPPDQRIVAVLEQLGLDLNRHTSNQVMHDSVTVSPDGLTHRQVTRQLVRAEDDAVAHLPFVFANHDGGEGNPPGVAARLGCSIGQLAVLDDVSTIVGEILLPQPLHRGDLAMFEFETLREQRHEQISYSRQLPSAVPFLVMETTFLGRAPEQASYGHFEHEGQSEPTTRRRVPVGSHLQVALRDAPSGVHELAWSPTGTTDVRTP